MSIPEYKPTEEEARLKAIVDQRNEAEFQRVFHTFETEYPTLRQTFPFLNSGEQKNARAFFKQIVRSMISQLSGRANFFNKRCNARQIHDSFVEIFSCPLSYKRRYWELKYPIQKNYISDDGNIRERPGQQLVVAETDLAEVRDLIADFLHMIGQLARQIHSCEMQRILRLIVTTKGKPGRGHQVSKEEAGRLADEIAYCFDAIKEEITLLTPEERVKLRYPKSPKHRPDLIIDGEPPENLTTEKKNKWSRDRALKLFQEEHCDLLPFIGFCCEEFDALKMTEEEVSVLSKSMIEDRPMLDTGRDEFDYATLGDVLSEDFRLYYEEYFTVEDFDTDRGEKIEYDEHQPTTEDTDQQKAKVRIIERLRTILCDAIRLASKSGSRSLELWQNAQVIFEKHEGDFHSYSSETDDIAEADLRDFLRLFREGREKLWADWVRFERKDIKDKPIPTRPEGPAMDAARKALQKTAQHFETEANKDKVDKRTPAERDQVNEVALAAIRADRIDHVAFNLKGKSDSVFRSWQSQGKQGGFETADKLRGAVRYDLDHHYNWDIEVAKMIADDKNKPK